MATFPDMNVPCPNCDEILIIPMHVGSVVTTEGSVTLNLTGSFNHDCVNGLEGSQDYYG